jgi:hypothetical protein
VARSTRFSRFNVLNVLWFTTDYLLACAFHSFVPWGVASNRARRRQTTPGVDTRKEVRTPLQRASIYPPRPRLWFGS